MAIQYEYSNKKCEVEICVSCGDLLRCRVGALFCSPSCEVRLLLSIQSAEVDKVSEPIMPDFLLVMNPAPLKTASRLTQFFLRICRRLSVLVKDT